MHLKRFVSMVLAEVAGLPFAGCCAVHLGMLAGTIQCRHALPRTTVTFLTTHRRAIHLLRQGYSVAELALHRYLLGAAEMA